MVGGGVRATMWRGGVLFGVCVHADDVVTLIERNGFVYYEYMYIKLFQK